MHGQPRAARPGIAGWHGDALEVRVGSPVDGGRTSAELVRLVAGELGRAPATST